MVSLVYRKLNLLSEVTVFTTKQNLHDFRYEGGAPINSGFQIPEVNGKRKYGTGFKSSDPLIVTDDFFEPSTGRLLKVEIERLTPHIPKRVLSLIVPA